MAIEMNSENVTVKKTVKERTWRIQIETPEGQVPWVKAHRELVTSFGDTSKRDQFHAEVNFSMADVADEEVSVEIGNKTYKYTGAEMALVIAAFIDFRRKKDLADAELRQKAEVDRIAARQAEAPVSAS